MRLSSQLQSFDIANIFTSIVEYCVGLCLTCVSTTSAFLRHTLPSADTVKTEISPHWKKFCKTPSWSRSQSSGRVDTIEGKGGGIAGPYHNFRNQAASGPGQDSFQLGSLAERAITTEVSSKPGNGAREGVIHLKLEFEQY